METATVGVLTPRQIEKGDLLIIPHNGHPYVVRRDGDSFKPIGCIDDTLAKFISKLTRTTTRGVQRIEAVPKELRDSARTVFEVFEC